MSIRENRWLCRKFGISLSGERKKGDPVFARTAINLENHDDLGRFGLRLHDYTIWRDRAELRQTLPTMVTIFMAVSAVPLGYATSTATTGTGTR